MIMMENYTGGPAFPCQELDGHGDPITGLFVGMTLRDYAAIKFAAAWVQVLGAREMTESYEEQIREANRRGLLQAKDFLKAREV